MVRRTIANYVTLTGGDNHSGYSELFTTTLVIACRPSTGGLRRDGAAFSAARSFYRQPGVAEPVVNPISGVQIDESTQPTTIPARRAPKR